MKYKKLMLNINKDLFKAFNVLWVSCRQRLWYTFQVSWSSEAISRAVIDRHLKNL